MRSYAWMSGMHYWIVTECAMRYGWMGSTRGPGGLIGYIVIGSDGSGALNGWACDWTFRC